MDGREKLAASSHAKRAASHKGRAHFYAHQKRLRDKEALGNAQQTERVRVGKFKKFKGRVADYWAGLTDSFPDKPR